MPEQPENPLVSPHQPKFDQFQGKQRQFPREPLP